MLTTVRETVFQFHKVRLKDRKAGIGIPLHKFQFHKVRLKGNAQWLNTMSSRFQFHKVRLKVLSNKVKVQVD